MAALLTSPLVAQNPLLLKEFQAIELPVGHHRFNMADRVAEHPRRPPSSPPLPAATKRAGKRPLTWTPGRLRYLYLRSALARL